MFSKFSSESNKTIHRIWNLLNRDEKKKIIVISFLQISLGLLDLIAVALVGIITALSVGGLGVEEKDSRIESILNFMEIQHLSFQSQVALFGCFALFALLSRTFCSAYFTQKIISYLSFKGAELSSRAIRKVFQLSLQELESKSRQEIVFSITSAPMYLYVGVIGSLVTVISESTLLFILICGLMFVDAFATLITFLILGISSYAVYKKLRSQAKVLGQENTFLNVESNSRILEVFESFRFLKVRNRTSFIANDLKDSRMQIGYINGRIQFLPHISKYYVEIVLIIFAFSLAAMQFWFKDAITAISTLAIFFIAGSRIAPASLRIQQGALSIRNYIGTTSSSLQLLEKLEQKVDSDLNQIFRPELVNRVRGSFIGEIEAQAISFRYANSDSFALEDINFFMRAGSFNSIVGNSGSGKSTLADIILGIANCQEGKILVSGLSPQEAISNWPGLLAYVPQTISLISGTIRDNITWGYDQEDFNDVQILNVIRLACLEDYVRKLPNGIYTHIGEKGFGLSGGQRQRIGIARALLTSPQILVLDEATSALDASTDAEISNSLNSLRGKVTIIVIAHRLSTVKFSDQVIYLKSGRLVDTGKFDEIRERNKEFDSQALLMGS